ncbi:hypothetical protein Tco_1049244 [Tanacetum coccineum]
MSIGKIGSYRITNYKTAEQKFLKVKQAFEEDQNQSEIIQELLLQLIHDLQRLDEILPKQQKKGINSKVKKIKKKEYADLLAEEQSATIRLFISKITITYQASFYQDDDNDMTIMMRSKIDPHHFNTESDLIESLLNRDISTVSYPKIDSLFDEFSGELAHVDLILPGINESYFDSEEDICLVEKSLDKNSSPQPPKELNFLKISDAINDLSLLSRYDDGYLDIEPDMGVLTTKVVVDISDNSTRLLDVQNCLDVLPSHLLSGFLDFTFSTEFNGSILVVSFPSENRNNTFDPGISIEVQSKRFLSLNEFSISFISDPLSSVLETLLPFSSENEDKVFNPDSPDYEDSRACGFVQKLIVFIHSACLFWGVTDIHKRTKTRQKPDKTEHEIGKTEAKGLRILMGQDRPKTSPSPRLNARLPKPWHR